MHKFFEKKSIFVLKKHHSLLLVLDNFPDRAKTVCYANGVIFLSQKRLLTFFTTQSKKYLRVSSYFEKNSFLNC
jgi:hypothetical protein